MIEKNRLTVVWDKRAYISLKKYCDYIRKDSPLNADLVLRGIIEQIKSLPLHPLKFPPDKFKKDSDGHFRAFES